MRGNRPGRTPAPVRKLAALLPKPHPHRMDCRHAQPTMAWVRGEYDGECRRVYAQCAYQVVCV